MERLTYRGTPQMTEDGMITPSYSDYPTRRIIERLADYEDAEEQGLLIKLPCKVGDIIYEISGDRIIPHSLYEQWRIARYLEDGIFGEFAFLTQEEAERKLAEMKGE